MADDGCPHHDDDTILDGPDGPMSLAEALADPDKFVKGMAMGEKTYCMWVPGKPWHLRTLIGHGSPVTISPFYFERQWGSLIETTCEATFVSLQARFNPKVKDGKEIQA